MLVLQTASGAAGGDGVFHEQLPVHADQDPSSPIRCLVMASKIQQTHKPAATTTSCGSLVVPDLLFRTKREVARAAAGTCFYFNELDACSLQQFGMGKGTLLRKVGDWRRARLDLPRPRYG